MEPSIKVLIADADASVRRDLTDALSAVCPNAIIIEVADGASLNAALKTNKVDILFVDVVLPQTNGKDILSWQTAVGSHAMIILVSDLLAPRWPFVAKKVGAYDVLLKPFADMHIKRIVDVCQVIRRKLELLIVDPQTASRNVIGRLLEQSNFTFGLAATDKGQQALVLADRRQFDLVIIEIGLQDMPGLELACKLQDKHPGIKLLMMGTNIDAKTQRNIATFGASGFLEKPFYFLELDKAVHQAFGLWRPYLINALLAEKQKTASDQALLMQQAATPSAA